MPEVTTMGKYKPYPAYKDSGVEWLGDVPEHWDVIQIKWLSVVKRGASPRPIEDPKYFDDDGDYSWVRIADVSASNGFLENTTQTLSELGASLSVKIYPKELFVSIAGTVGKPCISKIKACIHDGFVYFPELKIPPMYLYRIFESGLCYLGLGKMGTQLNLNTETIGGIHIGLPPANELTALLSWLDQETSKIDTLIEKQQKLIELLKEKRQAVISHAVTKGLNPNAKMKDSGIQWLDDIPVHWSLKRLKFNFKLQSEKVEINGQPVIALENIEGGSGKFIPTDSNYTGQDVKFKHGDILFGKLRPYLAKVFECKETGVGFGDILVYRPEVHIFSRFGFYSLINDTFIRIVDSSTYGAKMPRASSEFIGEMPLAIPPLLEQREIADYLDTQTQKIDTLIDKSQQAIELLKERKTALISAVVTGKIDVRGAVNVQM